MPRSAHRPRVSEQDALLIFDTLMRMTQDRLGAKVLGHVGTPLRDAYERCLFAGNAPLFWLEFPLLGEPHCDLHVSYSFSDMLPGARFAPGAGFGYQGLFDWFAQQGRHNTGIDFTIDLEEDGIGATGAYVSFHDGRTPDLDGFCASIGRPDDAWRCRRAIDSFPAGWRVWYASPFPGRPGCPVRAAGLASEELKQAFAQDPGLFVEHLSAMGIASTNALLLEEIRTLAALPVDLELRVTMNADGSMGERFDVSFYLSQRLLGEAEAARLFSPDGTGGIVLAKFEKWGVADARWHEVAASAFARTVPHLRADGSLSLLLAVNSPLCFMLPWRGDEPLPAKAYPKIVGQLL